MSDLGNSISPEGKAQAEAELAHLIDVRRPAIVAAIKAAREEGDLSENAEYHAAREDQGMNEARIRSIEHRLATATVQEATSGDAIGFGSTVSFRDKDGGKVSEVTLVHPLEARPAEGKISSDSPVAKALVGHRKGELVKTTTPRGSKEFEILKVE
jgi:transcription elongation factor GreA